MLERTDSITNEVLEPIMFVLSNPNVFYIIINVVCRMGFHIMYKKTCWGKRICFHKNINMIQTLLNCVILCFVCECYGKECTLILRAKRRRQLPQSAGRDRLHLFQQQKYVRLLHKKVSIPRCFAPETW